MFVSAFHHIALHRTDRAYRVRNRRNYAPFCISVSTFISTFFIASLLFSQETSPQHDIDSLKALLSTVSQPKDRADVLVSLLCAMQDIAAGEQETTPFAKELLDVSQRRAYERGVAWGICFLARQFEQRDNVLFGQYAYDALHRFGETRDTLGLAHAERTVAAFHFYEADYALSFRFYNQALERFEQKRVVPQVAWVLYHKAILYGYQGNYIVSLSHQFKALRLFEQLRLPVGIASANQDLGIALQKIGSTKKALDYFQKSLTLYALEAKGEGANKSSNNVRLAEIHLHIAECYQTEKNIALARKHLDTALYLVQQTISTAGRIIQSSVYDALGTIERDNGNAQQALTHFRQALNILDSTDIRGNDANFAVYRLGTFFFDAKKFTEAKAYFHAMLERSLRSGDKRNSSRAMLWLGKTHHELGNATEAARFGREALAATRRIGQLEFATFSAELLAKVFEQSDPKTSLSYTKAARELRDSIATLERTQQLIGMEALYNLDREKSVSELLKKDNEAQTLLTLRQRWLLIGISIILAMLLGGAVWLVRLNNRMKAANDELARQTQRIQAISKIGAEIASNLDLERAIVMTYGYLNQLMDAPILNIGDYLPLEGCIKMRYLIENSEFVPPPTIRMTDDARPAVRCIVERRPIVMNDIDIPVLVGVKPASLVYVPLISGERVIGVFSVQSLKQNSYPEENVNLLTAISAYIATALENTGAFAQIQAQQTELERQAAAIQLANVTLSERNVHLEQLSSKITDNVKYAQTIQQAMLPTESELSDAFSEHFVLYKPMEIISGDFYWLQRTEFVTLVAVVDCTGHGVPGAFMSMIGNDLLNQIVVEKGITNPGNVLTELHYAVRHALKQTNDLVSNQDGMDVCLCRIDESGISYAGARRPLFVVQGGELVVLEGNAKPIGGFQRETRRTFTAKRLDIDRSKPAMLYLTSDGFADQHNRRTREKFGEARLTALFRDVADMEIQAQYATLYQALATHQADTPQRDDITVMGVRLK